MTVWNYRRKPHCVSAVQVIEAKGPLKHPDSIISKRSPLAFYVMEWLNHPLRKSRYKLEQCGTLTIYTPNGKRVVFPGDWIVHENDGFLYTGSNNWFQTWYEKDI